MDFEKALSAQKTNIPGMLVFDVPVHGDSRGWFKENWQRAKMLQAGLPDFGPVQNNISFNTQRGVTRGIHAEPWDKFISVGAGRVFSAWVDLRDGESFGRVYTCELDPSKAIYVPRGVGNSYQALEDGTVYTYLVNAHWSPERKGEYTFVNLADPSLGIQWPIPLEESVRSDADLHHPMLKDARRMDPLRILVTGGDGQLGTALKKLTRRCGMGNWDFTDVGDLDITKYEDLEKIDWDAYGVIINCAAFTAVDAAEIPENRSRVWDINVKGPANFAKIAIEHNLTLVHISSDYVFDGTIDQHTEDEPFSPLGVYGQTKAAADAVAAMAPRHYIVRTSWVVGEGNNFVRTMMSLSDRCALSADDAAHLDAVTVVNDQFGRLTFTSTLAEAIVHLLETKAEYGTYNVTNSGDPTSWFEVAYEVFDRANGNGDAVRPVSTEQYAKNASAMPAPRPVRSGLNLSKIEATGYLPRDWRGELGEYMAM